MRRAPASAPSATVPSSPPISAATTTARHERWRVARHQYNAAATGNHPRGPRARLVPMSVIVRPIPPAGRKGPTTDLRVASTTVAHARGQPFLPQKALRMIWARPPAATVACQYSGCGTPKGTRGC